MLSRLKLFIRDDQSFMSWLRAVKEVKPPNWAIGAGAVRTLVWDRLHEYDTPSPLKDIDVCYFDASDLTKSSEESFESALNELFPAVWEVKNQAAVHLWYERKFGIKVRPFGSVEEGIASWPEICTAVAVRLRDDDELEVIAPFGLDDLFDMVVRRNPVRVTPDQFLVRLREKQLRQLWPKVRVVLE